MEVKINYLLSFLLMTRAFEDFFESLEIES